MKLIIHPPMLVKKIFPNFEWNINQSRKVIYLTFDDGPIPELTPWTLNTLAKYNAKATFFCVGDNVRKYPNLYNRILAENHAVGNHTFKHLNGWKTDNFTYFEDIKKADEYIDSCLFRPPHGKLRNSQTLFLKKQNRKIILWDIMPRDFDARVTKEECFGYVRQYAKPGSIIVLHDNLKAETNMKYTLVHTLEYFGALGYTFESITTDLFEKEKISVFDSIHRLLTQKEVA